MTIGNDEKIDEISESTIVKTPKATDNQRSQGNFQSPKRISLMSSNRSVSHHDKRYGQNIPGLVAQDRRPECFDCIARRFFDVTNFSNFCFFFPKTCLPSLRRVLFLPSLSWVLWGQARQPKQKATLRKTRSRGKETLPAKGTGPPEVGNLSRLIRTPPLVPPRTAQKFTLRPVSQGTFVLCLAASAGLMPMSTMIGMRLISRSRPPCSGAHNSTLPRTPANLQLSKGRPRTLGICRLTGVVMLRLNTRRPLGRGRTTLKPLSLLPSTSPMDFLTTLTGAQ